MQSNYELAKTAQDKLFAVSETLTFMQELVDTETSLDLNLSEIGRNGLGNFLTMIRNEIYDALEIMGEFKIH